MRNITSPRSASSDATRTLAASQKPSRTTQARDAGLHGTREGAPRPTLTRLCPKPPQRNSPRATEFVNSVLVDSDILIEVSRGRDQAVLERWRELAASDAM